MAGLLVKICGITNHDDAKAAVEAGAAMLGFNFYPPSPRYIEPLAARRIIETLPNDVASVGVFVNETSARVGALAATARVTMLQFHGDETPSYCAEFACPVIKAVRVRDAASATEALRYKVTYLLADAYVEGLHGGTGRQVEPNWLGDWPRDKLMLAGGLTPENVARLVCLLRPAAVDVASGVESAPRRKDHDKMRRFVANALAA